MRENNHRLSVQQPDGRWQQIRGVQASAGTHNAGGAVDLGRVTAAGNRLVSWLRGMRPHRQLELGLTRPEPAPYRPNNRARMARRRTQRRIVSASRRANR